MDSTIGDVWVIDQSSLYSKNFVNRLFDDILKAECTVVDFQNVDSVSRSSAEELIVKSNEYDFEYVNMNSEVEKMMTVNEQPTP